MAARRNSGSYTFTDLAQLVIRNLREDPNFLRSRKSSVASSRSSSVDPRRSGHAQRSVTPQKDFYRDQSSSEEESDDTGYAAG